MTDRRGRTAVYELETAARITRLPPARVRRYVRVGLIRPVRVDRTEVFLYPALLKGVAEDINTARLRGHEAFYGPAGDGGPDDVEMFERNQVGLSAQVDPWLLLARGLHREQRQPDGTTTAHISDELPLRAIWRRWRQEMTQEAVR